MLLKMTADDLDLLKQFADNNSQDAFTALVHRHLNLVYSAALRQVRSPQLAEEVAQSVFTDLARNAGKISGTGVPPVSSLTPWLYTVTRRTAIDVVRREARRQLREHIAVEMTNMNATANDWTHIEPFLDDAMHTLDETDRAAVLLRYFENKSFREVGQTLGTSDDAAQKRVSRAVERLREFFSKRGVTVGASGLVVVISANAVQAAPVGLVATISTAAILAGTTTTATTTATIIKTIAMTTLQKTIVTATVAVLAGTGIYEARQAAQLRDQVQTLRQQQTPMAEQIRQLQQERDEATNQLAGLLAESAQLKSNAIQNKRETLKLRSETTQLQEMQSKAADDPFTQSVMALAKRAAELNNRLRQMPDKQIPELQWLDVNDWLKAAQNVNLDTDDGVHQALNQLRDLAKHDVGTLIGNALDKYISQNNGLLPDDISKLEPYFNPPMDPTVLQHYQMMPAGGSSSWAIEEIAPPVDNKYDSHLYIGPKGHVGTYGINHPDDPDPSWSKNKQRMLR